MMFLSAPSMARPKKKVIVKSGQADMEATHTIHHIYKLILIPSAIYKMGGGGHLPLNPGPRESQVGNAHRW